MTISEAIDLVNRMTANQISDTDKIAWLSDLDLYIYKTILVPHGIHREPEFTGYGPDTDPSTSLIVPAPFDELYRWHLEMQIHSANKETARYNTAVEMYNAAMLKYMDYVSRHYFAKPTRVRWW